MEFVPGGSLEDAVRVRPLRPAVAACVIAVLARAVDYQAFRNRDLWASEMHSRALIRLEPENPLHWEGLGMVYASKKEWTKAKVSFAKAIEFREVPQARMMLSPCPLATADSDSLRNHCSTLLDWALENRDIRYLNNAVWIMSISGELGIDPSSLIPIMLDLCEKSPAPMHINTLALVYYRARQWDLAAETATTSLKKGNKDPFDWIVLAMCRCQCILNRHYPNGSSRFVMLRDLNSDLNALVDWRRKISNRKSIGFNDSINEASHQAIELPVLLKELTGLMEEVQAGPLLFQKLSAVKVTETD